VAVSVLVIQVLGLNPGKWVMAAVFGPPVVACFSLYDRPRQFALAIAAVFLAALLYHGVHGETLFQARSFFGIHRVTLDPTRGFGQLGQGNTVHNRESTSETEPHLPLTYYHPTGPIGKVFEMFSGPNAKKDIGVVGLGAGSLAYYAEAGQHWTFFEI